LFGKPKYGEAESCADEETNCDGDLGLTCVSDLQEKEDESNVQTLCVPSYLCGAPIDYFVGSDPDNALFGLRFQSKVDPDCLFEKPRYFEAEDCQDDRDNCADGLACAEDI